MFYRGRLSLHPSVCITPKPELTSKEGIGYTNLAMLKVEQVRTTAFDSELLFLNVVQVLDFVRICVWSRMRCARGFRSPAVRFRRRPGRRW